MQRAFVRSVRRHACAAGCLAVVAVFAAACSSCRKGAVGRGEASQDAAAAPGAPAGPAPAAGEAAPTAPAILPEAQVAGSSGAFSVERGGAPGKQARPPGDETALYVGDGVITQEGGSVEVSLPEGASATLGPRAALFIGRHAAGELVLARGDLALASPPIKSAMKRIRVQTPAGTYFHAGPASRISVALDGAVRFFVEDCPPAQPAPVQPAGAAGIEPVKVGGCAWVGGAEERPLVTGDLLVVDARLGESLAPGQVGGGAGAAGWLAAADAAFEKGGAETLAWFAGHIPAQVEKIDAGLAALEKLKGENKGLIDALRDLREKAKTAAGGAAEKGGEAALAGVDKESAGIKQKLAENSRAIVREREKLLAAWYQLSLRWSAFEGALTDELLAKAKKDRSVMQAFIDTCEQKLLQVMERKPRRQFPGKLRFGPSGMPDADKMKAKPK